MNVTQELIRGPNITHDYIDQKGQLNQTTMTTMTTLMQQNEISLTREGIRNMSCNLKNIYEVLSRAFEQFDKNNSYSMIDKDD